MSENELRRLAAWWRACKGDESFTQALNFCAGQLELYLDGDLKGFETTTVYQGGRRPIWTLVKGDGEPPMHKPGCECRECVCSI